MKKRILAAMLTLSMVVSMTACGNSDAGGSKDSAKNNGNGDEPYTVTMVLNGSTQPDEERIEQKINEILEPELNANLDIVVLPWASASQQLQLMLSGDEKIDVFYTQATNAVQYMNAGQIVDMSELIDKYGTNIKQIYGEDIAKINQIEGFVYGVPNQIERGSIPAVFMRKDLVEKYNIDTSQIKEPKDLESVFETVKAGEPDMTMLYSINDGDTPVTRLFRGDNLSDNNYLGVLMDQTNSTKLENFFATDWFKDTTTMLYNWYQKGYISQDAGTNTENWRTVCKAGNLFSLFFAYHPGTPVEFESSTGYDFEIVPFYNEPIINSSSYNGVTFSIAQNSENPEKTMEVLDYIYGSSEIMNLLNWGEQDKDYVIEDADNGIINFPEGITSDNAGYNLNLGWELPNQFIAYKWTGSDPQLWEKMEEFNSSAKSSKAVGFLFDSSNYSSEIAALSNIVKQYSGALYSGSGDPDELIPELLEALDDAGINEVIQAKQEQLDAFLAAK
ncbi:ABC transporter substrate-binding protein [Roseburia inulinivorans]|jgi:putative aldouronate transport system substrate-binding protein|uniref:Extracellular solute-binding protein n=1 Tax=Roseburia inulinivorans TaxID=360807 RepID=A0A396AD02_9FIRM|nr:ABC transporter substrate-binding protein [Roseburia inulinivorans]RHD03156.1 extracellular solute-binding protein [Roseburia inulinivorans]